MTDENEYFDEFGTAEGEGHPPQKKKGSGCAKYVLIGCCTMLVLIVIGGFFVYRGVKGLMSTLVEQYTDTEPRELPKLASTEEEAKATIARVEAFRKALNQGKPAEPLILDGDNINQLIQYDPAWSKLAGKVYVAIEEDHIGGDVSIPLDDIGKMVKGRYLNGSTTFNVALTAGRLVVYMESLEVNGQEVPAEFMQQMRTKNLAEDQNKDEQIQSVVDKLESITVKDGKLYIVPKKTPDSTENG